MVPLHNMGVKCLLVLGGVVATLPVAREPKGKQIQSLQKETLANISECEIWMDVDSE